MTEKLGGNLEQAIRMLASEKKKKNKRLKLRSNEKENFKQVACPVGFYCAGKRAGAVGGVRSGNLVQGIVNSVNEMVETSQTAQNALSTWKETSKIFEQGREYYEKLRKVNDLISGSEKVKESVLMLSDISEIYVKNYGRMLTDKNFTQRELNAISAGYNTIMKRAAAPLPN